MEANAEEDEASQKTIKLVRPHAIALRLAAAAGLFGAHGAYKVFIDLMPRMLPTSPSFPPPGAEVEAPVWAQMIIVLVLLVVFAAAVMEADAEEDETSQQTVKLVRPH